MSDRSIFRGLHNLGRKLKESKLDDLGKLIIGETPIGKIGRIVIGAAEILGTEEDPDAIAEALETATPEQKVALAELATREKEAAYADRANDRDNITARHAADMLSDNALSKNLRPSVCIALNAAAVFASFLVLGMVVVDFFLGEKCALSEFWKNELANTAITALWTAAGSYNVFYVGGRVFEKRGSFFAAAGLGR